MNRSKFVSIGDITRMSDAERLQHAKELVASGRLKAAMADLRANPKLMAILARVKTLKKKRIEIGDGDASLERLCIELAPLLNIDALTLMERLDHMNIDMVEPWLDAALRKRESTSAIDYVTLLQCAAMVHRSKRALERWKSTDTDFPPPEIIGGNGESDEWRWATIRPYLELKTKRKLPAVFPSHVVK